MLPRLMKMQTHLSGWTTYWKIGINLVNTGFVVSVDVPPR